MYKFSLPMPYQKELIDRLININNEIEKSKIETLYFSLPTNSKDFTGFEQDRFNWDFETDFEYWKPLIEYSLSNGFDFIYVLNSPKIFYEHQKDLHIKLEELDRLINNLRKIGCNKLRVCNPQLIGYINQNYPDFYIYLSTSSEIKIIREYINLFSMFSNIKECVPSWDVNKNFRLLKNLRIKFPDIKLELMVNEGCMPACPLRVIHNQWSNKINQEYSNSCFSSAFFMKECNNKINNNLAYYLCHTNIIYPWEIKEYFKVGINNFKLVGRNTPVFRYGEYFNYYEQYLKGVDNIKNIENTPIRYFNNYILSNSKCSFTVKEVKSYLPNINHFKKYGHLCSSSCIDACKYCRKCTDKIQKIYKIKQQYEKRKKVEFCFIDSVTSLV